MASKIAKLYRQFRQSLKDYISRQVEDASDAEDIVQDVFLRLTLLDETIEIESYAAWLWRTARNRIIDFRRKRREVAMPADTADTLASGIGTNDTDLLRQTFWQILEETLAELPREQREAFVETELKGKRSYIDITLEIRK